MNQSPQVATVYYEMLTTANMGCWQEGDQYRWSQIHHWRDIDFNRCPQDRTECIGFWLAACKGAEARRPINSQPLTWIRSQDRLPVASDYPIQVRSLDGLSRWIGQTYPPYPNCRYLWAPYREPAMPAKTQEEIDCAAYVEWRNHQSSSGPCVPLCPAWKAALEWERTRTKVTLTGPTSTS